MLQKLLRRVRGNDDAPAESGRQRRGFRGEDPAAGAAEQAGRAGGSFASVATPQATPQVTARPTPERDADATPSPRDS